jgi:catechol 2,3-dioxygenase-like lactoylglutathione lyase family enzyme
MDMKLEVVVIPVSDVERAKRFYQGLGWRLDVDYASPAGDYRIVHLTPPNSRCSVLFGHGVTNARPGAGAALMLAVNDIDDARRDLISRGADVSEPFHDAAGGLGGGFYADAARKAPGHDPQRRSYATYASFSDPDGNQWLLQELTTRLPGREWESKPAASADAAALAELLRETSEYHGRFEKTHPKHDWWDWYAPYLSARRSGSDPEAAAAAADRRMEAVLQAAGR